MARKTYSTKKSSRSAVKSSHRSLRWYSLAAVGLLLVVLAILELTNTTHLFHKQRVASANIPSTTSRGGPATSQSKAQQDNSSSVGANSAPAGSSASASPAAKLIAPWGNFVSNHRPGQDGAPTTETSACNTTPGASCYIQFTSGDLTRTLDTKVADSNGSVIWNWDVAHSDFSPGSWKITAITSLNGQTQTASDSQSLEVQ